MKIEPIAKIMIGQDGAIYDHLLFRFDHRGNCRVYDLTDLSLTAQKESLPALPSVDSFVLDRTELLCPHSNAVFFGRDFFEPSDPFPLLYSNMYNNCAGQSDRKEGVLCAYRLQRESSGFHTTLVQVIKIGFAKDPLWYSSEKDVRPYGNFTADTEKGILCAFTMRDKTETTRYFSFALPAPQDGTADPLTGIRTVTLTKDDILTRFDCEYHRFLQGACCHRGLIYSVEGFLNDTVNRPALRIINPETQKQESVVFFGDYGFHTEAEMIDFLGETCLYSDGEGTLFHLSF